MKEINETDEEIEDGRTSNLIKNRHFIPEFLGVNLPAQW